MKQFAMITRSLLLGLALGVLVACGGGGGEGGMPSVSTLGATGVQFGRTMTVTVNGRALDVGDLRMVVDGPCVDIAKAAGASELQLQFTCRLNGLGDVVARIKTADSLELASVRLNVPVPQVSMTVAQGTRSGTFVLELDPVAAPITVENFLAYVNSGFYVNTIFHRVIAGFVAQAGGFVTGPVARTATRPAIKLEANNGLKNLRGTIAMARLSEPDTANAQFFLNLVDNPSLDFGSAGNPLGYAVFGRLISGQAVVDEIGIVDTKPNLAAEMPNLPVVDVRITAASQTR
jgi:cyclophilin family peptidyl-prolyl cis-trans isomerase